VNTFLQLNYGGIQGRQYLLFTALFFFALCFRDGKTTVPGGVVAAQASRLSNKDSQTVFRGRVALCAHAL